MEISKKLFFGLVTFTILITSCQKKSDLTMPNIFSDKMVLQRNSRVPIWGKGRPDNQIKISSSWENTSKTVVSENGRWKARLQTPQAGGPHTIKVKTQGSTLKFENVLIGEVWFCSGQSNMQMPIQGWGPNNPINNSAKVIQKAQSPKIRMFTLERRKSLQPLDNVRGKWEITTPRTVKDFSATAYFFGRKIHNKLNVPVGLIHSSWGGTPAEAWTSKDYLKKLDSFEETVSKLDQIKPKLKQMENWYSQLDSLNLANKPDSTRFKNLDLDQMIFSSISYNDENWSKMELPKRWENSEIGEFNGVVWFRKELDLPEGWQNKDLTLELGRVDDMDETYFNRIKIGSQLETGLWSVNRIYNIPSEHIKKNKNVISVCNIDIEGDGGIYDDANKLRIYPQGEEAKAISLAGQWKYLPYGQYKDGVIYKFGKDDKSFSARPPLPFKYNSDTPTVLYNAMINPLIPYRIKGTIWYQGESNANRPYQYKKLFPTMIKCWRDKWNQNIPFYYV